MTGGPAASRENKWMDESEKTTQVVEPMDNEGWRELKSCLNRPVWGRTNFSCLPPKKGLRQKMHKEEGLKGPYKYLKAWKIYADLYGLHSLDVMAILFSTGVHFLDLGVVKMEPKFLIVGMDDLTTCWRHVAPLGKLLVCSCPSSSRGSCTECYWELFPIYFLVRANARNDFILCNTWHIVSTAYSWMFDHY